MHKKKNKHHKNVVTIHPYGLPRTIRKAPVDVWIFAVYVIRGLLSGCIAVQRLPHGVPRTVRPNSRRAGLDRMRRGLRAERTVPCVRCKGHLSNLWRFPDGMRAICGGAYGLYRTASGDVGGLSLVLNAVWVRCARSVVTYARSRPRSSIRGPWGEYHRRAHPRHPLGEDQKQVPKEPVETIAAC